jgi:diphosphomevalonate decarboxylase
VIAPANIAFIKYTVEHLEEAGRDEVLRPGPGGELHPAAAAFSRRVEDHLKRLRSWAGVAGRFRVATENSFPMGAGMASSASGFAALTLAVVEALGRRPETAELTTLARLSGSGSAARSVLGGYVLWPAGEGEEEAHAVAVAPAEHWDLRDVIAVLDGAPKAVSSREGHRRAPSSPYFETRLRLLPERLERVRAAIERRSFEELAPVVEEEAIDLHLMAMSSRPPIFYWQPATLGILAEIREMRDSGLQVCATMDAGANVHVICSAGDEPAVAAALADISEVSAVIRDGVGEGPVASDQHLF